MIHNNTRNCFLSTVLAQDHFYSDFLSLHVTLKTPNSTRRMRCNCFPTRRVPQGLPCRVDDSLGTQSSDWSASSYASPELVRDGKVAPLTSKVRVKIWQEMEDISLQGHASARKLECKWAPAQSKSGEAGHRSQCLSHAKRALYHLSYIPMLAHQARLPPHFHHCLHPRTGTHAVTPRHCHESTHPGICQAQPLLTTWLGV